MGNEGVTALPCQCTCEHVRRVWCTLRRRANREDDAIARKPIRFQRLRAFNLQKAARDEKRSRVDHATTGEECLFSKRYLDRSIPIGRVAESLCFSFYGRLCTLTHIRFRERLSSRGAPCQNGGSRLIEDSCCHGSQ